MPMKQTRRRFLTTLSMAGAAGLVRVPLALAAEGALETTTVRIFANRPGICVAPQYIAEALLRAEGFTDVRFVGLTAITGAPAARRSGPATPISPSLCGASRHRDRWRRSDHGPGGGACRLLRIVRQRRRPQYHRSEGQDCRRAGLGLEPACVRWLRWPLMSGSIPPRTSTGSINPSVEPIELYEKGKIDAFLGFPPEPQELRARHIGHVVVNSAVDRPWSQYFCCMLAGNREYVRKHPVATKRVLRAILKAADLCATDPRAPRGSSSMAASPLAMIMPCRR